MLKRYRRRAHHNATASAEARAYSHSVKTQPFACFVADLPTVPCQIGAQKSLRAPHKYQIKPAQPLDKGEYAFYLERGEGLPAMLYDFSVQ